MRQVFPDRKQIDLPSLPYIVVCYVELRASKIALTPVTTSIKACRYAGCKRSIIENRCARVDGHGLANDVPGSQRFSRWELVVCPWSRRRTTTQRLESQGARSSQRKPVGEVRMPFAAAPQRAVRNGPHAIHGPRGLTPGLNGAAPRSGWPGGRRWRGGVSCAALDCWKKKIVKRGPRSGPGFLRI
eukprot:508406-Prorocentrum_minimum.AAC.1